MSGDRIKLFLQLLTSDSFGVIGHLTVDGRKPPQVYIIESIFERNTDSDVTPILLDVHMTIIKSRILKDGALVTLKDSNFSTEAICLTVMFL